MLSAMPLLFGKLGLTEIIIVAVLVLLLFGGKKIPELMRGMGRGVKEFKDAVNGEQKEDEKGDSDKKSTDK